MLRMWMLLPRVMGMVGRTVPRVNTYRIKLRLFLLLLTLLAAITIAVSPSQASVVAGPLVNPANGHAYYLLSNDTWAASEAEAVTLGGHLATIRSAAENAWVYNTFGYYSGSSRYLWIGLNDLGTAGTFAWVGGDSSTYKNWTSGEPNNIGTERYGFIYSPTSGCAPCWGNATAVNSSPYGVVEVIKPLSSLAITGGPATVYTISMASYTATATFTDSSTAVVTPTMECQPDYLCQHRQRRYLDNAMGSF